MSVISDLLAQIRTAVYGREVRESIASGIEQCYTDVQSGVTTAETAATAATSAASAANTAASAANTAATNAERVDISQNKASGIVTITTTNRNNQQTSTTIHDTEIDDTAGVGSTGVVWSADKLVKEFIANVPVIDKSISTEAAVQDFADGADGIPMKVVVGIDPVQDLHGFDFPWVGGAGKNLCPATVEFLKSSNTSGASWSGNVCTKGNVTYSVQTDNAGNVIGIVANGSDTSNQTFAVGSVSVPFNLPAGEYVLTGCPASGSTTTYRITVTDVAYNVVARDTGSGASFTLTEQTGVIVFCDIRANYSASDITFKPMIRLASVTDDTFEPYTNICNITGWTGAKITTDPENIFVPAVGSFAIADGTLTVESNGVVTLTPVTQNAATKAQKVGTVSLVAGHTYYFTGCPTGGSATGYSFDIRIGSTILVSDYGSGVSYTPENDVNAEVCFRISWKLAICPYMRLVPCISESNESTTYNISFPSEAGTVYDGKLTINKDGSGTLVSEYDYGESTSEGKWFVLSKGTSNGWAGSVTNRYAYTEVNASNSGVISDTDICNMYKHGSSIYGTVDGQDKTVKVYSRTSGNSRIRLVDNNIPGFSTAESSAEIGAAIEAYFAGLYAQGIKLQAIWKLSTPAVFPLTPGQVKSLLGYNALWADTGNIKSLEYCADSKLYIEASIASAFMEAVASVTETQEVINEYGSDA